MSQLGVIEIVAAGTRLTGTCVVKDDRTVALNKGRGSGVQR